ncbi:protein SEED AND ROOT HAIR PROTECTIVE PROTEIN-like [Bidens hawaiensis]|uniref:protein SEED AND ROOT HAIR PROTECTIVE PROTEIN-like n=1 Tax=Bidens hawaiensis TaxID=980011 RepID=UPI00404AACB9
MKTTTTTMLCAIVLIFSVATSVVSASAYGAYGGAPSTKPIAIQGLIYCKSGSELIPLKGATARVTCLARNHMGLELAPFSVSSCPADDMGYFLAKLSPPVTKYFKNVKWELKECKAYLEKSPLEECKVPLDINGGVTGVHIISSASHRLLKNSNLYSIKPFFYTSDEQPKPASNNNGY